MAQHSRDHGQNCIRQPQSLEALYRSTQNFCNSIQRTLDAIGQQCMSFHMDKEDQYVMEVLERINAFDGDLKLDTFSDAQCKLLTEDLEIDTNEDVILEIVKRLRDLELLRKSANDAFFTLNKRLSSMLDNGVYIFCVSLIELTRENVSEVTEYNDFTSKQRSKLTQAVAQIKQYQEWWSSLTTDTESMLNNLKELRTCLEQIQEEWNKIRVEIIEWINQDREYPTRLANRIKQHKEAMQGLLLEIDAISKKKQQKVEEQRHRDLRMETLQKRRQELCSNLRLVQRAKRFNATKLAACDSGSAQAKGDREEFNSAEPSTAGDGGNAIGDSKAKELYRRRDAKLAKEQSDIKLSLKEVNKRIIDLQRAAGEEEREGDTNKTRISGIRTEIAQIEKISTDCREILLRRGKVKTFLQLQRGVIAGTSPDKIDFGEVCKFVAIRVRHEWPRLYLHLPMWPPRSPNQRRNDITTLLGFERMNVVLPRNRTADEDAMAALEKWRLLSRHHVDVGGLATGLKLAGWSTWAKEVRSQFGQEERLAAESGKVASEAKEAEDTSVEAMLGSEIEVEAIFTAENEEGRLARGEVDTASKSLHDVTSKITGHQNWSGESGRSGSMHRGSVGNIKDQSSPSGRGQRCLGRFVGSTAQKYEAIEALPAEKDVLAQERCTCEEISRNLSMRTGKSRGIVNESEKEEQNSYTDPSGNSSDTLSEQEKLVDKSNDLSREHREEDNSNVPSNHLSCRSSLSNDDATNMCGFPRRKSRHGSPRDEVNTHQNQGAIPCMREMSSKTSSMGCDSYDSKSQNSFDKDNGLTEHDGWESCKNFKVESVRSEKDKDMGTWKKELADNRCEIKERSVQTTLTSEKVAKPEPADMRLDEKSESPKQLNEKKGTETIAEIKKGDYPNICALPSQMAVGRLHDEDEDNGANSATLKNGLNGQEDKQGSDKFSKFGFEADLDKFEDDGLKSQDQEPIHERKDSISGSDCSKEHSPSEDDHKGGDQVGQFLQHGPNAKSTENIQKPLPKSNVSLEGQRNSKNKKSIQPLNNSEKSCEKFDEKIKGGSKPKRGLTHASKRGGHCAESNTLSQKEEEDPQNSGIKNETDKRISRITMGSELLRKTPTTLKSKKESRDGKGGSGGNCNKRKK